MDEASTIKAAALVLVDVVLDLLQADPHQWSKRPCPTCRSISTIVNRPFGCYVPQKKTPPSTRPPDDKLVPATSLTVMTGNSKSVVCPECGQDDSITSGGVSQCSCGNFWPVVIEGVQQPKPILPP